jgi:two-component system, chemotaxis family, CheB/CheR fusion protein
LEHWAICFRWRIGRTRFTRSDPLPSGPRWRFPWARYPERIGPGTKPHLVAKREPSWNAAEAQKEFDRRLLQQFAPAALFLDEGLEVVHSRGNVDRYLKLSSGRASLSILKMAREGLLLELRNAIARAKKENATVRREHVEVKTDHAVHDVTFEVIPLRVANTREPYLMIVFEEGGAELEKRPRRGRVVSMRRDTSSKRVAKLEQELVATNEYLHTVIENQEATNEELQSANEKILSSNEELQSTNEELETAKEELQSTNEELSTVNDELRSRNLEITQANNDLLNLLASIDVAVVMLGSDLKIRRFTPEAQKILGLIPADVGRPFEDVNEGLNIPNLHELIVKLVSDQIPFERELRVRSGKSYILRATPYRTSEHKIEGAVITFIGMPQILREGKRAEDMPPGEAAEFMLVLDPELRVKAATPSFYRAFQLSPEAVLGDNPELQKAQQTSEAVAPFTVELKMDGDTRRKFECKLEPITLEGAKMITLSLRASIGRERSAQTRG